MEVNPADLNFPKTVIARIIKEALPEGVTVSKEAKNAIARSAAIFILHATSLANDNAQSKKRKNLAADDILSAIHQLECDELKKPVKDALTIYTQKNNQRQQRRRERKAKVKKQTGTEEKRQQKQKTEDAKGEENSDIEEEMEIREAGE